MRSRVITFAFGATLLTNVVGQANDSTVCGTYVEALGSTEFTRLTLRPDGSFLLKHGAVMPNRSKPVMTFTALTVESEGTWSSASDGVVLNPDKQPREPRKPSIHLEATMDHSSDSIVVRFDHLVSVYEDGILETTSRVEMSPTTLYLNKRRHFFNAVRGIPRFRGCLFSPKLKHPVAVDGVGMVRFPRTDLQRVGIMTNGLDAIAWFDIADPKVNHLEFTIEHAMDTDWKPRSKKVVIKRNKAFIHEWGGKVRTGSAPLVKQ